MAPSTSSAMSTNANANTVNTAIITKTTTDHKATEGERFAEVGSEPTLRDVYSLIQHYSSSLSLLIEQV